MHPGTDRETVFVELYEWDGPEPATAEVILLPAPPGAITRDSILLAMLNAKATFANREMSNRIPASLTE